MEDAGLQDPFALAGTVLEGQYRTDAVVGEGGFGVVYRGRHLSLDQPIAIKVLKGLDGGDPSINALVLEKFRAEARLLYTLSQSSLHIVRALDFGAATMPSGAWAPFMILEWLEGRALSDDLVDRRRQGLRGRSLAEVMTILQPVADGLAVAHQRQVAHRDIKPANIFLLKDGPASGRDRGPQVKVLDFGIAKIMKEGESAGTKGTFASFTWLYASPEQLDPRLGATGLATDVYAFGLLLTELLTDRKPMEDKDVIGIMKTALNPTRRPTPRTKGANVPDAIEALCLRALAVNPKDRFANISEFWSALAAAHGGGGGALTVMHAAIGPPSVVAPQSMVQPPSASALPVASVAQPPPPAPSAPSSNSLGSTPRPYGPPASRLTPAPPMPPSFVMSGGPPPSPPGLYGPPPGSLPGPPPGTRPPGMKFDATGPHQPGYGAPMMPPYTASPPVGTAPPGQTIRRPFVRPAGGGGGVIVPLTIIFFILTLFLAGTCAVVHTAC